VDDEDTETNFVEVLKHSIVAKAARGRGYINVRGVLRDLTLLNDFEADMDHTSASQEQLKTLLASKSTKSESKLDTVITKLDDLVNAIANAK
jgi:hypothetical protein|tara:strand:- start:129 stop:404 length:276 start_codon:yes stop_codon:yes gene_type:complete